MGWKPRIITGGREPAAGSGAPGADPSSGLRAVTPGPSDAELTRLVVAGAGAEAGTMPQAAAHAAFGILVERHGDRVTRLAWHLLGNGDDARDVAQDTFLRAWRSITSYRPDLSFVNWLLRITVNAAHDHRARRGLARLRPVEEALDRPSPGGPGQEAEAAILADQVQRAAAQLHPREREVFVLRDLEGLEVEEISVILGVAEPTVRRHLARARLHLRAALGPRRGEP